MIRTLLVTSCVAVLVTSAPPAPDDHPAAVPAVEKVLDTLHDAASKADGKRYFSCFAPDAVFFGTDATERWTIDQFRAYAQARFDQGTGWTYHPRKRHVFLSRDRKTAWFDETLHNAKYGECRGTGVLVKRGDGWKITQYNLTIPIPNEIALEVVERIREVIQARSD